jgi:hypothetical protein
MRIVAWILAVFYMASGAPMLVAPLWWFGVTPGVTDTGPFNAHFVVDAGIAFTVSGLAIAWGAAGAGWRLVLIGSAFPAGHALFHILGLFSGHGHGPVFVEVFGVVLPAGLSLLAAMTLRAQET